MTRMEKIFARAVAKATALAEARPLPTQVAPGLPGLPFLDNLLADHFHAEDSAPLLRSILGKDLGERSIEEHIVFSGYIMAMLEVFLRSELGADAEESAGATAQRPTASARGTTRRKRKKSR